MVKRGKYFFITIFYIKDTKSNLIGSNKKNLTESLNESNKSLILEETTVK